MIYDKDSEGQGAEESKKSMYPVHEPGKLDRAEATKRGKLVQMISQVLSVSQYVRLWNVHKHDIRATSDPLTNSSRHITPKLASLAI